MGFFTRVSKKIKNCFRCAVLPAEARVNRSRYLANSLTIFLILAIIISSILMLLPYFGYLIMALLMALSMPFPISWNLILASKRLHDINRSGWWLIANFIPGINFIFPLAVMLIPGTKGANRFGEQPEKSSRLVYAAAFFSVILWSALGILIGILESKSTAS